MDASGINSELGDSRVDNSTESGACEPPMTRRSALGKAQRAVIVAAPLILLLRPGKAYAASHHSS